MNTTQNKLADALREALAACELFEGDNDTVSDAAMAARAALAEHDAAKPGVYAGANEPTPDHVTVKAGTDTASRSAVTWAMTGPHIVAEFYGPRQTANAQFFADALNGRGGGK